MPPTKTAMRGVPLVLQDSETEGDGLQIAIPPSFNHHQIIITGSAGVSAGAIQPETAMNPADTDDDNWAPVGGGPITVVADESIEFNWQGSYIGFRARISTTVADGTVSVTYQGHP